MIKGIIIGALGTYVFLVHPDKIQDILLWTKQSLVYALDWVSLKLKS